MIILLDFSGFVLKLGNIILKLKNTEQFNSVLLAKDNLEPDL